MSDSAGVTESADLYCSSQARIQELEQQLTDAMNGRGDAEQLVKKFEAELAHVKQVWAHVT